MSQYPDLALPSLNYVSLEPTPPPTYLTAPPAAASMGYRSLEGAMPSFTAHASLPQTAAVGNHEILHERLLVLQDTMKWVVQNQHKLLEKMEAIMSNQKKVEESLKVFGTSIVRFSEEFDNWKRQTGSDASSSHCSRCEDEGDTPTPSLMDTYLRSG